MLSEMPPYVFRALARTAQRATRAPPRFTGRYAYGRASTLPCFTLEGKICVGPLSLSAASMP